MYTRTFSPELHDHYKEACKENNNPGDIYHCATPKGVTRRFLRLDENYVFCAKDKANGDRPEYRIQAYLVSQAKANNWQLQIRDKAGNNVDWILLDAERNFADTATPRKLDLLAFSPKLNAYIVMELKMNRAFTTARRELEKYIGLMKEELRGANTVYGKKVPEGSVYGYVVAPKSQTGYNKNNDAFEYGVILFPYTDSHEAQKALFVSGTPSFDIYEKVPQQG